MEVDVSEFPQESVTCWVLLITAGAGIIGEFNYFEYKDGLETITATLKGWDESPLTVITALMGPQRTKVTISVTARRPRENFAIAIKGER